MTSPVHQVLLMEAEDASASYCLTAQTFLARTSGLDATHRNAYAALICGLVDDGVWTKFDVLYIFATQDSTTALLNLVSSSYNGTSHGSPIFTADMGFTGVLASTTVYIDTNFNPSTAGGQYTQDAAHISVWSLTNTTEFAGGFGSSTTFSGDGASQYIISQDGSGFALNRVNVSTFAPAQTVAVADGMGHLVGVRDTSSTLKLYKTGSNISSLSSEPSQPLENLNLYALGWNGNGSARGSGRQYAMASAGGALTATEVTNFYDRVHTYMVAVGAV